ncbi:protein-L-isoaspartate O-methyltransferase [Sinorhizobium fredii]
MAAMLRVLQDLFVPAPSAPFAYQEIPLPIGFDKTVSLHGRSQYDTDPNHQWLQRVVCEISHQTV